MNNRLQFTESLKNITKKHGKALYEDSNKLKAFLMDYLPTIVAERNLLVSAIDAGVFDTINNCADENKKLCFNKAKFTLQNDLFIEENIAEYIVYSIAYSLDLCSLDEVKVILEKIDLEERGHENSRNTVNNPPANNSNSNTSSNQPVNPSNPNNGQNNPTNTFTDFFKNKIVVSVACLILLFGIGYAVYSSVKPPPPLPPGVEEKLNDYIIVKNKNGQEIRKLYSLLSHWSGYNKLQRMELKNSAEAAREKLVEVKNKYKNHYRAQSDYSETLLKIFNKEIEIYDAFIVIGATGDNSREKDFERLYNEYLTLERIFKQEK